MTLLTALTAAIWVVQAPVTTAWAQPSTATPPPAEEASGLFVYVDDAGSLHVVSSLDLVPARYQSRARPAALEAANGIQAQGSSSERPTSSSQPRRATYQERSRARQTKAKQEDDDSRAAPEPAEDIQSLRAQRAEALDELGQLEEGWATTNDEAEEPTAAALEERSEHLTQRIADLERRIEALKRQEP